MNKKQGKIYVANCIECGERFTSTFKTSETDKNKLYEMGCVIASGWGAECISVKLWKPKQYAKMYDIKEDKFVQGTKRAIDNFIKKHPNSIRYDYSKTEYFNEEEPKRVWDCDLTDKENLAINAVN